MLVYMCTGAHAYMHMEAEGSLRYTKEPHTLHLSCYLTGLKLIKQVRLAGSRAWGASLLFLPNGVTSVATTLRFFTWVVRTDLLSSCLQNKPFTNCVLFSAPMCSYLTERKPSFCLLFFQHILKQMSSRLMAFYVVRP